MVNFEWFTIASIQWQTNFDPRVVEDVLSAFMKRKIAAQALVV